MQDAIVKLIDVGVPFGLNLIAAIVIYIIGKLCAKGISSAVEKVMLKSKVDIALAKFTKNLVYAGIIVFTIIAAVGRLGVQTASLIAVLGAAGLAVGMALQGTLSNFAAGVMLVVFRPFKLEDFVEVGGELGTVKEIQIFNTIIYSVDNRQIILPNSKISGEKIINYSALDSRRIDLVFGIAYTDDMKKAKEVLMNILVSDERILKNPEPFVAVSELGDSSVNLVCRPWVKPEDYWAVYFDVVEKGKEELEKAGCSIPFPQRDVHLYSEDKS